MEIKILEYNSTHYEHRDLKPVFRHMKGSTIENDYSLHKSAIIDQRIYHDTYSHIRNISIRPSSWNGSMS